MKLRTINLSILASTSLIVAPLSTISCQQKQISLSNATKIKDFGYVKNLTIDEMLKKLITLNPDLEISDGELTSAPKHNKAFFFIEPQFQKKSKYQGNLEVKFSSYITPLYSNNYPEEFVVHLNQEQLEYTVEFEINEDYFLNHNLTYSTSGDYYLLDMPKEKINDERNLLTIYFKLKNDVTKKSKAWCSFTVEDAELPRIRFEIN